MRSYYATHGYCLVENGDVEIFGDIEKIVSWSNVNGKLKKIVWKSQGDKLIHDLDIGYQLFEIVK